MMERSFAREVAQLRLGEGEVFHGEGILAVTKALLQSGVAYVGGYQGSPISHLLDVMIQSSDLLDELGVHLETPTGEAAAAAMLGASINYPLRGAVTWKSTVGTNVASDALSNLCSAGVKGGALIVVGEDYGEGASIIQERSHAFALKSSLCLLDPRPPLPTIVRLVEKGFEQGRVLMCCTTANAAWTNLPSRKLYLAMVHGTVYYLVGARVVKGEYIAGSPVRFILPRRGIDLKMRITDPVGRVRQLTSDPDSDARVLIYDDTHATGVYYCQPDKEINEIRTGVFVVNPDAKEGDLSAIPEAEAKAALGNDRVFIVSDVTELGSLTSRIREGVQIWNLLLFVVLGIAVAECFLANKKKPEGGVRMVGPGSTPART